MGDGVGHGLSWSRWVAEVGVVEGATGEGCGDGRTSVCFVGSSACALAACGPTLAGEGAAVPGEGVTSAATMDSGTAPATIEVWATSVRTGAWVLQNCVRAVHPRWNKPPMGACRGPSTARAPRRMTSDSSATRSTAELHAPQEARWPAS